VAPVNQIASENRNGGGNRTLAVVTNALQQEPVKEALDLRRPQLRRTFSLVHSEMTLFFHIASS
jgi:hypothetical protein